ncbi:hypothetical protein [Caenimonas soli]|uniref:hypothetical protein n=1 Tax=Caenimonas soli TaxID=2735555 RepID=UPI0015554F72|nr:hypothetical protein [Caenimonas soli]NPC54686.1 hypothetical protein [Caenimonas soli]
MKKLILSVLGAASLCAGPAFSQEAGNVNDNLPGPQFGTMEWVHRYGPNAVPPPYSQDGRLQQPHYPYVVPAPRILGRDSATLRREREIAALREREMALQREREIALQRERERDIAARRDRQGDRTMGGPRERDRDGDGVGNRRDRYPDDPYRN